MNRWWCALAVLGATGGGFAQDAQLLGTVSGADAVVTAGAVGGTTLQAASGERIAVGAGAMVTAKAGRNAKIDLTRGGSILVCQSTELHVTAGTQGALMLVLGRGAMEVRTKAGTSEVIVTPDMRLIPMEPGPLDLRMHVTFNGDTCVENRGHNAPALNISDAFGEVNYLLKPGQHVMFENGSLRTVEDHESTPCGCPPAEKEPKGMSLADAVLSGKPMTPKQAAAAHPFPEAQSAGLAAPEPGVPETPGERHVQVASTIRFDASGGEAATAPVAAPPVVTPTSPPPPEQKSGAFAAIGRFFKRIFVR